MKLDHGLKDGIVMLNISGELMGGSEAEDFKSILFE